MKNKSNYKAFFVQSYIGNKSSVLNQVEKLLVSDQVKLTTAEELSVVRRLKSYTKADLTELNKRKIEVLIVQLFEVINRRKRLVERRGDKILQSLGVQPAQMTSDTKAKAYTLFYTGKFSAQDYEVSQVRVGEDGPYNASAPPDGYGWKSSDIRDIAIQYGYFTLQKLETLD